MNVDVASAAPSPLRPGLLPLRRRCVARALWVVDEHEAPMPEVIEGFDAAGGRGRVLRWMREAGVERSMGRVVGVGGDKERDLPMTLHVVSPRMLWHLVRAPEDVIIVREVNLVALYAVLSKLLRARKVVALIEGDLSRTIGPTGSTWWKVVFRRLVSRFIDLFLANGHGATTYLRDTLRVAEHRVADGWWLAGFAAPPQPHPSTRIEAAPDDPLFLSAGRLLGFKGIDLLLRAFDEHRRSGGGGRLWIAGDGPERGPLEALAEELELGATVRFLGAVPRVELGQLLAGADAFVFPTLRDLVGRVVVESITAGTPAIVSVHSGAAEAVIRDDVNGRIIDPTDQQAFARVLAELTDPDVRARYAARARSQAPSMSPAAAAAQVVAAVERVRR